MSEAVLASVIVNNYNYGRFLRHAIDSALGQTYANTEVIVVDDGSADDSREIITGYGDSIIAILKSNGGQASAFNAGFAASRGDVILFLDADDMLLPSAVGGAVSCFRDPQVVKAHWPLWKVDQQGRSTGDLLPASILPDGDLRADVLRRGPGQYPWPPTTGNAWTRRFLEKLLPMPELQYRIGADTYLFELAPFFGPVKAIREPQGCYRLHDRNNWLRMPFDDKLRHELAFYNECCAFVSGYCRRAGLQVDPAAWKAHSWWHRLSLAVEDLATVIPLGAPFVLVDQDEWGLDASRVRRPIPFLERAGVWWGPPPDDATAIGELERLRHNGADFLVVGWPAFWWLDHYAGLHIHLRSRFPCVLENERVVVLELRPAGDDVTGRSGAGHAPGITMGDPDPARRVSGLPDVPDTVVH